MADQNVIKSQLENNPSSFNLEDIKGVPEELDKVINALVEIRSHEGKLNVDQQKIYSSAVKYRRELEKIGGELEKSGNGFERFNQRVSNVLNGINDIGESILNTATKIAAPWGKADQAAYNFGKTIGASATAVKALRDETIKFANDAHIGSNYNATIADMIKLQESYTKSVGRNLQLTNKQRETLLATSKVMGDNTVDFARKLENLGIGLERSGDLAAKMYNAAAKSGISFEKTSKYVTENLTKVQNYGFKNGVEGLTAMAKRAAEVNLNIAEAFKVADKIQTGGVQEAIKMGAGLQVLGGNFASFGDPMGMLYQGINDVEGLQERMIKMFTGYGGIKNGEFKISGANRLLVNQAAQTMGVDANEMYNMISRQAVRDRVEKQMGSRFNGDEELKQLLLNTATLNKDNQAVVNIRGEEKKLSEVTDADKKYLQDMQKSESEDIKDIAQMMRGYTDVQEGFTKEVENRKAKMFSSVGEGVKKIFDAIGHSNLLLTAISISTGIMALGRGMKGIYEGGKRITSAFKKIGSTSAGGAGVSKAAISSSSMSATRAASAAKNAASAASSTASAAENTAMASKSALGATKVLSGTAGKMLAGGAAGGAFAALGYAISGDFKGPRENRNKAKSGTVGATIGGALGTMLPIPVIGSMIGTVAGQFIGETVGKAITKVQDRRRGLEKSRGVSELGTTAQRAIDFKNLQGDYTKSELEKIKNALKDGKIQEGELNKKLLKKLAASGDTDIVAKYGDDKTKEQVNKIAQRISAKVGKGDFTIENGNINLKNANLSDAKPVEKYAYGGRIIGASHDEGGVYINAEGGEYVVSKEAVAKNEHVLDYMNAGGIINPEILGKGAKIERAGGISNITPSVAKNPMEPRKVKESRRREGEIFNSPTDKLEVSPIKLDVSGTIKLDSNGKQVDLDAIINNPAFINQLSQMIERRLSDNINGGNFKEMRKNKQHTF